MVTFSDGTPRQELVNVIRQVRSRWRMKLLLRGGVIVLVGALIAIALASFGLQTYKFSPSSVIGFRIAIFVTFAALLGLWLVRPIGRRVSDLQVALYVEEHEPSLQAAILSAVDIGAASESGRSDVPPVIVDKLVEQAVEKARTIEGGKAVGRTSMKRHAVALAVIAGIGALLLVTGPEFLRQGASALLTLTPAEAASPYAIKVTPGDVKVPKGSDQAVSARLAGFRSNEVALMVKLDGEQKYARMPLVVTGDATAFEGMLFDVKKSMTYYVEADGVRSPSYSMTVVELPAVAKMDLEYVFPAYTGLPNQIVENGGDVAALRGTEVRVRITATMPSKGGRLQLDPGKPSGLATQADGVIVGSFKIGEDGYYHVELDGPNGENVTASPKYTIDAIEDQPPTVAFEKPKRDTSANPVEEVFVQARADDDFGVKQLDLVYSVNGGPEKTVSLYGKGAKSLAQVSSGTTIYMEELGVKTGDSIAYYAKAQDNDVVKGPKVTSSDIYFITIRPFSQNFREAQSQEGGGGGGGGGGRQGAGALSEQQRQIISATFNVERDKNKNAPAKVKEDTVFVQLAQSKLREEVDDLINEMRQRVGGGGGENLQRIAEALPKAVTEMKTAEDLLKNQKPKEALAPEQRALKHLQDAEQAYELEVRRQQQQGGGGGGGGQQMSSELADLFQLQLDRMANQYEQQQRESQQSQQQQIDELAEKLRELARRQLQQAEQQRRMRGQQGGSGSGSAQRSLADEVEEAARQLEQLRRELERQGQQRQDLADAQRRLQESANSMRQSAANSQDGGAQAQRALQQLQEANRLMQNNQSAQSGQNVRDLQRQADDLARQQRELAKQVGSLDQAGAARDDRIRELSQQKTDMRGKVADIENQLGNLSRQALSSNQRDAARKLQEAAGTIRDQMVKEKIDYSKSAMAGGSEYSKPIEQEITSNLDTLRQKIGEAAAAADKAQQSQGLNRAVDNMRDVARGLDSLGQQMAGQQDQQGQQGQGQQGQGQQGQGQQGQGQQGQGQQGQGQQGQGQQGQGQQGQGQQGQGQQGQGQQGQGQQGQGQQGQGQQGQGQQGQGQQGQGQQGQGQGQGQQGQGQGQGQGGQGQGQGGQGGQGQGGQQSQGQQGRDGQQGPRGQQRLTDGQSRGGGQQQGGESGGMTGTPAGPGQSGGDARPGMNRGEVRQWANQANQLANDTQNLRRQLQQGGVNAGDLQAVDEVVKALRALGDERNYQASASNLQQLFSTAVDRFKALEFELRKRLDTTSEQLYLSGSEDVPPNFRSLIEEYSRLLSKKPGGKGGQ